jgi:2-C-methyl-D-erythritol 4-phosphate cytidylyltransferase/2-C-methyl-D-erythritol 2,4-cyclodiphosphate synthase
MSKIVAIVPAAGVGSRFGEARDKIFYPILNRPLLLWTLKVLQSVNIITEIIPVLRAESIEMGKELIDKFKISKVRLIIPGGKERQDSVYNALNCLDEKTSIVVIHDGARPVIEKDLVKMAIKELIDSADHGIDGVIIGVPVKDTIKEVKKQGIEGKKGSDIFVDRTLSRNLLWAIQTPQVFFYKKLIEAYKRAYKDKFYSTDDSALVEKYGGIVKVITGSYKNIKVTTLEDIDIAEVFLRK